jgi:signal transduction histidine kinase
MTTWAQPISENGKVIGIASVTADVTDRQRRERDLLEAVTREQQRFGRDLHDGLGQELTGAALLVRSLVNRAAREAPEFAPALEEVLDHLKAALSTSRAVALGVSPVGREQGGLVQALNRLLENWQGKDDLTIAGHIDAADSPNLDPLLADNLYRIAQEALTNVARHSDARHATLEFRQTKKGFRLLISDDGCGMALGTEQREGFGLKSIRGRAELVGAQLRIDTQDGKGTSIECLRDWTHERANVAAG